MEIYLIRHPKPDVDMGVCYGGKSDLELLPGWEPYLEQIQHLSSDSLVISSPLMRCLQVAKALSDTPIIVSRLKEMDFGEWELQPWNDINTSVLQEWMSDYVHARVPGGESFDDLYARITGWWSDIQSFENKRIVIITHAGVIRSILAHVLHIPLDQIFNLNLDFFSVSKLRLTSHGTKVEYINHNLTSKQLL